MIILLPEKTYKGINFFAFRDFAESIFLLIFIFIINRRQGEYTCKKVF